MTDIRNNPFAQALESIDNLDADAKNQVGTLLVAIFVGGLATLARVAVIRRNRWWMNMLLIHGVIFAYWWNKCHLNEADNPWLKTIHSGLCWRNSQGRFQQIVFWGGDNERFWLNVLVWLAILGNVVPAYATGNEAGRHMTHVKRRACNPLVNHIIAGILCVVFPYFVVTWRNDLLIPIAVIFDIYHQITIHRLIANHDGIWVLRAVSMSLAITKWIVILNMTTTDPWNMLDQIFILSTGFLGTRAYGACAFLAYYAGLGDIKSAEWYSIGLMTADIMIMGRFWNLMRVAFWLTVVNCAAMHYHQTWKKWLHLRPHFVGMTCVLTVIVCHSGSVASLMFTVVWSFGNFMLPHFNRLRPAPAPEKVWTPTVTPAYKLIRQLSARLGNMSTRSVKSIRQAMFRNASGLGSTRSMRSRIGSTRSRWGNGNLSTRSIFNNNRPSSTRSLQRQRTFTNARKSEEASYTPRSIIGETPRIAEHEEFTEEEEYNTPPAKEFTYTPHPKKAYTHTAKKKYTYTPHPKKAYSHTAKEFTSQIDQDPLKMESLQRRWSTESSLCSSDTDGHVPRKSGIAEVPGWIRKKSMSQDHVNELNELRAMIKALERKMGDSDRDTPSMPEFSDKSEDSDDDSDAEPRMRGALSRRSNEQSNMKALSHEGDDQARSSQPDENPVAISSPE